MLIDGDTIVKSFSPLREQGGVSAQGAGHGAGAFIAYEFSASAPTIQISLVGLAAGRGSFRRRLAYFIRNYSFKT